MEYKTEIQSPNENVIEINSTIGIAGYFEVELIHKPTNTVKQHLKFKNIITNAGLEGIGNGSFPGSLGPFGDRIQGFGYKIIGTQGYLGVGTGSAEPAATDTTMSAEIGTRTRSRGSPTIDMQWGNDPSYNYWWRRTTKVLFPGESTGALKEVALFKDLSGGIMYCRQLFRDSSGNPVTINKTADDELRVTYEFRIYPMQVENVTTLDINGVSTTCTTRGYNIDDTFGWGSPNNDEQNGLLNGLGTWGTSTSAPYNSFYSSSVMPALTNSQTGTATAPSSAAWGGYVANSRYRDVTLIFNPGLGTLPIGSIIWGGAYAFNSGGPVSNSTYAPFITTFNPPFIKTENQRFTFVGRMFFGRV
jgi:hypothetical protein